LTDRNFGVTGRVGRSLSASAGVIGLFDGLFVGYQVNSKFSVSVAPSPGVYELLLILDQEKFAR